MNAIVVRKNETLPSHFVRFFIDLKISKSLTVFASSMEVAVAYRIRKAATMVLHLT